MFTFDSLWVKLMNIVNRYIYLYSVTFLTKGKYRSVPQRLLVVHLFTQSDGKTGDWVILSCTATIIMILGDFLSC